MALIGVFLTTKKTQTQHNKLHATQYLNKYNIEIKDRIFLNQIIKKELGTSNIPGKHENVYHSYTQGVKKKDLF